MIPGYDVAKLERGPNSFKRMQASMAQFIDQRKADMYGMVVADLEENFGRLQVDLRSLSGKKSLQL